MYGKEKQHMVPFHSRLSASGLDLVAEASLNN